MIARKPIRCKRHFPLFLGSISLGILLCALLPSTRISGVAPRSAQLRVGAALDGGGHLSLLDILDGEISCGDGEGGGDVRGPVDLGHVGLLVTLLGGVGLAGKQYQALLVSLEAGDIDGEGLFAEVLAAGVDGNSDCGGERTSDSSFLHKSLTHGTLSSPPHIFSVCSSLGDSVGVGSVPLTQRG